MRSIGDRGLPGAVSAHIVLRLDSSPRIRAKSMPEPSVTQLLREWREGSPEALEKLTDVVYGEHPELLMPGMTNSLRINSLRATDGTECRDSMTFELENRTERHWHGPESDPSAIRSEESED